MDGGRYSWETAVLKAFTATPQAAASQVDIAHRAIAQRLNDQNPPDVSETSVLMYALEALDISRERVQRGSVAFNEGGACGQERVKPSRVRSHTMV
jgi:hypothetical protein